MSFLINPYATSAAASGGTPSIQTDFTKDQLTPKWLADASPSTLIVANGTGADWDLHIREIGNVIDEGVDGPQRYKLTYTGHNVAVGSYTETTPVYVGWAYSADGVTWTKSTSKLISARALEDPFVVKHGGTYYLFAEDKGDNPFRNIRLFTSTDFATWTDQGDILDIGASGSWEDQDVSSPTVWLEGSTWKMLYEGRQSGGQQGAVGLATASSPAGPWTKDAANPVFQGGDFAWSDRMIPDDLLLAEDGTYVMLYHGFDGFFARGAVAHSSDLYTWTDPLNNVSTRLNVGSGDNFTIQFCIIGGAVHFIYARDSGSGIRKGDDMGYESLVVNFTGSNGSTSFTDESAWGHTLTAVGNAQIQSNKLELDGSGDYVTSPDSDQYFLAYNPFTIELFGVVFDSNASLMTLLAQWTGATTTNMGFRFDYRGDLSPDILRVLARSSSNVQFFDDSSAWTPTVGTSYNLCFERSGNTLRFYVNGSMLSSTAQTETYKDAAAELLIGANKDSGSGGNYLDGRMSAVRMTVGKALYATDTSYTVPTLPLVPSS